MKEGNEGEGRIGWQKEDVGSVTKLSTFVAAGLSSLLVS